MTTHAMSRAYIAQLIANDIDASPREMGKLVDAIAGAADLVRVPRKPRVKAGDAYVGAMRSHGYLEKVNPELEKMVKFLATSINKAMTGPPDEIADSLLEMSYRFRESYTFVTGKSL